MTASLDVRDVIQRDITIWWRRCIPLSPEQPRQFGSENWTKKSMRRMGHSFWPQRRQRTFWRIEPINAFLLRMKITNCFENVHGARVITPRNGRYISSDSGGGSSPIGTMFPFNWCISDIWCLRFGNRAHRKNWRKTDCNQMCFISVYCCTSFSGKYIHFSVWSLRWLQKCLFYCYQGRLYIRWTQTVFWIQYKGTVCHMHSKSILFHQTHSWSLFQISDHFVRAQLRIFPQIYPESTKFKAVSFYGSKSAVSYIFGSAM